MIELLKRVKTNGRKYSSIKYNSIKYMQHHFVLYKNNSIKTYDDTYWFSSYHFLINRLFCLCICFVSRITKVAVRK